MCNNPSASLQQLLEFCDWHPCTTVVSEKEPSPALSRLLPPHRHNQAWETMGGGAERVGGGRGAPLAFVTVWTGGRSRTQPTFPEVDRVMGHSGAASKARHAKYVKTWEHTPGHEQQPQRPPAEPPVEQLQLFYLHRTCCPPLFGHHGAWVGAIGAQPPTQRQQRERLSVCTETMLDDDPYPAVLFFSTFFPIQMAGPLRWTGEIEIATSRTSPPMPRRCWSSMGSTATAKKRVCSIPWCVSLCVRVSPLSPSEKTMNHA